MENEQENESISISIRRPGVKVHMIKTRNKDCGPLD